MRGAERLCCALVLGCMVAAGASFAGPADEGALQLQADHWELDRKAGRAVYKGNVRISQQGMRIEADEVVLQMKDGELDSAVITGQPAVFEQTPPGAATPTRGSARRMTLLADEEIIELRDDARLTQDGDEVSGELIRYDVKRQQVLSSGKVEMTITPRKARPATPPAEDGKR